MAGWRRQDAMFMIAVVVALIGAASGIAGTAIPVRSQRCVT